MAEEDSELAQRNQRIAIQLGEKCMAEGADATATAAFKAAVRLADKAMQSGEKGPAMFGTRGAGRIGLGNFDGGIADLREAIRLNGQDRGQKYKPSSSITFAKAALEHGEEQVRQMLKDRPLMAEHVKPGDAIWQWAVRKFAGEDLDDTIDWDPTPPREASAAHSRPGAARRGSICVSKYAAYSEQRGPEASFDELWGRAIFELHNIVHRHEFDDAWKDALSGKLTEEGFVARLCAIEHKAVQEARAFYVQVYLPWAKNKRLKTYPSHWHVLWWGRPEDSIKRYEDKSSYPWQPYVRYYLRLRVGRLLADENYEAAIATTKRYLEEAPFPDEKADAHCFLAEAYVEQGKFERAAAALAACWKVAPKGYTNTRLDLVTARVFNESGKLIRPKPREQEPGWLDLVELYRDKA